MASYRLVFKKSVSKDLRPIPNEDIVHILDRLRTLEENPRPRGSEKLSGQERYRLRQGVYRIIYEIADDVLIVTIIKIGHRKQVYESR